MAYDYDTAELAAATLMRAIHQGDQAADSGDTEGAARQYAHLEDALTHAAQGGVEGLQALVAALARTGLAGIAAAGAARGETTEEALDAYQMHLMCSRDDG